MAGVGSRDGGSPRTAVVIVHGMGEQLPLSTLRQFVKTALPKVEGERRYFSRPAKVTDSYEARRFLAYRQPYDPADGPLVHGQVEFFEYHWSYKMTGNRFGDFVPTFVRLLLRTPRTVPSGLLVLWWLVWVLAVAIVGGVVWVVVSRGLETVSVQGVVVALLGPTAFAAVVVAGLTTLMKLIVGSVTDSFVDVARYVDRSPRSYAVRRDIRDGMVSLLRDIHNRKRYSRVIVVAHSLGGFIAYDGITSLWYELADQNQSPSGAAGAAPVKKDQLPVLEKAARRVASHPADLAAMTQEQRKELRDFRSAQFDLWRQSREQGSPWLITDFITVGTPMYFADLLFTHNREEFDQLVKNSELPQCPPRAGHQTVEGADVQPGERYSYIRAGRRVLVHGAPFAVVRWTNLYFPAERHWFGDWFGGPLRPLFGRGILDRPVVGNLPGRRTPGLAHSRYFSYPQSEGPDDMVTVLHGVLDLSATEPTLVDLQRAAHAQSQD